MSVMISGLCWDYWWVEVDWYLWIVDECGIWYLCEVEEYKIYCVVGVWLVEVVSFMFGSVIVV